MEFLPVLIGLAIGFILWINSQQPRE